MFNNYAKLNDDFEFVMSHSFDEYMIEMIIEQKFATQFDDIYTMHIYANKMNSHEFVVDCAFELHSNEFENYENETREKMHAYDMRVKLNIANEQFDIFEICNTIDFVEFEIINRNAYITYNYAQTF
jgi:hypothetical protein